MAQSQRREYLIGYLLQERPEYAGLLIPMGEEEQRRLFAALRAAGYDGTVSIEGGAKASFESEIRDAGRILREILVD